MTIPTLRELIDRADASHRPPVIFIHGLWLKPNSWDRWIEMFEAAGFAGLAPGWPAEVGGAAAPETMDRLVAHFEGVAGALSRRPAIIGHAFGGLIAQALAETGVSAATVSIDPAQSHKAPVLSPPSDPTDVIRNPQMDTRRIQKLAPRGPLLVISRVSDRKPPPLLGRANGDQKNGSSRAVEFAHLDRPGTMLTISDWREAAQTALKFVTRYV